MPLSQCRHRHQFSIRRNTNKGKRACERNPAFKFHSCSIHAQLVPDVDEDAVSVKLPEIPARIGQLPIDGTQDVAAVCVQQNSTDHSDVRAVP